MNRYFRLHPLAAQAALAIAGVALLTACSGSASLSRPTPLVVMAIRGRGSSEAIPRTTSSETIR